MRIKTREDASPRMRICLRPAKELSVISTRDVLQIIGYGGIGGVLQCLLVNNLYSRRAFPKVACRTIRGHDERLFVADFVSEEVAVAVETIPEMHNDRVERI